MSAAGIGWQQTGYLAVVSDQEMVKKNILHSVRSTARPFYSWAILLKIE